MKNLIFLMIAVILQTGFLYAQTSEKTVSVQKPELRRKILEMFKKDQAMNKEVSDNMIKAGTNLRLPEDVKRLRAKA